VLYHIIFINTCAQNVVLRHGRKAWTLTQLANSRFNKARSSATHSPSMRHFNSSTYDLKTNTIRVKHVTDFQRFCGFSDFWADTYATRFKFIVVNGQTTTSAFYKAM